MMKKLTLNISVIFIISAFVLSGCSTQLDKLSEEHQPKKRENYESKTKESSEIAEDVLIKQEAEFSNEDLFISDYESVTEDTSVYYYKNIQAEQLHDYRYTSLRYRFYRLKTAHSNSDSHFRHHRSRRFDGLRNVGLSHHSARLHYLLLSGHHVSAGFRHGLHQNPAFNF